eukprot:TRINITY_DN27_c0_g1_i1.p1 TRINITY_DN27_c0_g1~~TRINITY_DN27_c0_g1_i1.p1  ORF type:complete len:272 (-),score=96.16 TRINITY_DN27_c0_g1_i1:141-956(-)
MSTRCIVYKNTPKHGEGTMMIVPDSIDDFLAQAGNKLGIKGNKAYTATGGRIDDVSLIRDDEKIFISQGEPFYKVDNSRVKTYKIAVLGSGGVGKSCLSLRYVKSTFVDIYDPTIEDAFRHQTTVTGQTCILDILDTAGQEDMQMLRRQWIEDRDGFLLVFSIVDRETFEDLRSFYDLITQVKEDELSNGTGVPIVLVGNKKDLHEQREVSQGEAKEMADEVQGSYIETSAKSGDNVNEAFEELVRNFMKLEPDPVPGQQSSSSHKKCTLL